MVNKTNVQFCSKKHPYSWPCNKYCALCTYFPSFYNSPWLGGSGDLARKPSSHSPETSAHATFFVPAVRSTAECTAPHTALEVFCEQSGSSKVNSVTTALLSPTLPYCSDWKSQNLGIYQSTGKSHIANKCALSPYI